MRRPVLLVALLAVLASAPAAARADTADIPGSFRLSAGASDHSALAFDDHGQAHVDWTTKVGNVDKIHLCRVPPGATSCSPDTVGPPSDGGYQPTPLLEDASDGAELREVIETVATNGTYAGKTVVVPSSNGGSTYGAPRIASSPNLILPDVITNGPGTFSWSALGNNQFYSGPLDATAQGDPVVLGPAGGNDNLQVTGIGFPDPLTPLAVWEHTNFANNGLTTIAFRRYKGSGGYNTASSWEPFTDFTPSDGVHNTIAYGVTSGPKGVFVMYMPQNANGAICGTGPEILRWDDARRTFTGPSKIDADPHSGLDQTCGYDDGIDGSPFLISQDAQGVLHAVYTFHSGKPEADQSVPQGMLYTVSYDGGQTWQKPISLATESQLSYQGDFHLATNADGDGFISYRHQTDAPDTVIEALRLPPLSAFTPATNPGGGGTGGGGTTTPGPPAAPGGGGGAPVPSGPCRSLITVGLAKLLATQGCWTATPTGFTAVGAVRVNGIDLLPGKTRRRSARASIVPKVDVDTAKQIIKTAVPYIPKISAVTAAEQEIDWQIPKQAGQFVDAAKGDPVKLAIDKGQEMLGLPVSGFVIPSLDAKSLAKLPMNLELPEPLEGVLGKEITDDITFDADALKGVHLDRGSINIDLDEVDLGIAKLSPFKITYDQDPFKFEGDLGLELPADFGELDAHLAITDGDLTEISGAYTPPDPGIAVATGVYLTKVSFGLDKGKGCDPTSISIGADLSGGGKVAGASLLDLEGTGSYQLGSARCHLPAIFEINGTGKLVGVDIGRLYFKYTTPAKMEFGGSVSLGDPAAAGLTASLDGGIDFSSLAFFIEGKAQVTVLHYDLAKVDVIGSSIGLGACAHLDLLPGVSDLIPGLDAEIDAGGYVKWSDKRLVFLGAGCDVSFLKPRVFTARTALTRQSGAQSITVAPNTPKQSFIALGKTKAPAFVLRGPGGETYTTPTAAEQQNHDGPAWGWTLDGNQEAQITVTKPAAGTWTITPVGTEPITEITGGATVKLPTVHASVRHVRGRTYELSWTATGGQGDVAVDALERGKGSQKSLGTLKGSRGVKRFTASNGPAGRRQIVVSVHGADAPATAAKVVASYTAPGPSAPAAPKRVAIIRGGSSLRVSWSPSSGASRYVLRATLADGRKQEIPVAKSRRSAVVAGVPGLDSGAIEVYAIGPTGLISKPGKATLKARKPAGKKKPKAKKKK